MEQREEGRELEIKREMYYIKPKTDRPPTLPPEAISQLKAKQKLKSKAKLIRLFVIFLISPLLVYGGIFAIDKYETYKLGSRVPASIRDKIHFPIYLPPADTDYSSFTYGDGVVLFRAGSNKDLIFTEQKKLAAFNLEDIAQSQQLVEVKRFDSPIGKAVSGITNARLVAIVETEQTVINITIADPYTSPEDLVRNLRKVD